jgi:heme/copper-type cytochrome/quinol oxidase subunit 3
MSAPEAGSINRLSAPDDEVAQIARPDHRPAAGRPGKIGMWMFLASDAMGFGGLLMAYAILRVRADQWPDAQERLAILQAAFMTAALVTSSFTITMALRAARAGRDTARLVWLAATIVLGISFLGGQALEYQHLVQGPNPMGLGTDLFASTFYAITGYHGLHVLAGVVMLVALLLASRPRPRTLEVVTIFWHFVDLAWIPIFSFVYLLPIT